MASFHWIRHYHLDAWKIGRNGAFCIGIWDTVVWLLHLLYDIQDGPKSKPLPNYQKSYYIVLKPAIQIREIRQIKVLIEHYNIIRWL